MFKKYTLNLKQRNNRLLVQVKSENSVKPQLFYVEIPIRTLFNE